MLTVIVQEQLDAISCLISGNKIPAVLCENQLLVYVRRACGTVVATINNPYLVCDLCLPLPSLIYIKSFLLLVCVLRSQNGIQQLAMWPCLDFTITGGRK